MARVDGHGVYVIWKPGERGVRPSVTIRVGQGDVPQCLVAERNNPAVLRHGPGLLVTWAVVDHLHASGVEAFLAQELRPVLGARFALVVPHAVNLPAVS